jgi:hypothetical protein
MTVSVFFGLVCLGLFWQRLATGQSVSGSASAPATVQARPAAAPFSPMPGMMRDMMGMRSGGVDPMKIPVTELLENLASATLKRLRWVDDILERKTQSAVERYAQATEEKSREEIRSELNEAVEGQFRVRQAIRDKEISALEDQVKRLRELLDKREKAKQKIVGNRLDQLLQAAEGLGWGTDGGTSWRDPKASSTGGMPGTSAPFPAAAPAKRESAY